MFDAKLEKVIITNLTKRGKGTGRDPYRIITEIWQLDGTKIAEVDLFKEEEEERTPQK